MARARLLLFLTLLTGSGGMGQNLSLPIDPKLLANQLTPVNPDVTSLTRYSMSPPSYSNGLPQQNIPLLEIKENGLSYPISLYYNYSGFKPKEESSTVGLGWGLTEGMITRIVKHIPDEHDNLLKKFEDFGDDLTEIIGQGYMDGGYYANEGVRTQDYNMTQNRLFYKLYDAQPDLYIYNFAGHTGKFFWINNTAIQLQQSDIRIVGERMEDSLIFTLLTADGVQYRFTEADRTTSTPVNIVKATTCEAWNPLETYIDYGYPTAWRLQTITNTTTQAHISFSYSSNTTTQVKDINQISSVTFAAPIRPDGSYFTTDFKKEETYNKTINFNYYVSEIVSDHYKVSFLTTTRKDGDQSRIQEIQVFDKHNQDSAIRKITFNQGYFGDTTEPETCWLKLKKVTIEGMGADAGYQFSYIYDSLAFGSPDKTGLSIDHWGYFNGSGNSTLVPLTGSIIGYLQNESSLSQNIIAWANRDPSFFYAKSFALQKVQYPTGGFTTINYESANGRGIRVASQEDNDGQQGIFKYYQYGADDDFIIPASYSWDEYYTFSTCENVFAPSTRYRVYHSTPWGSPDFFSETDNFYEQVTEYIGTPDGAGGRTEYKYIRLNGYGNETLPVEKTDFKYGSNNFVRKEKSFFSMPILRTMPIWRIPMLMSTAIPTGICLDDPQERPGCGPVDSLQGYILGSYGGGTDQISAIWIRLDSTETIMDDLGATKRFTYAAIDTVSGLPMHTQPVRVEEDLSNGQTKKMYLYYPGEADPDTTSHILGIPQMWDETTPYYTHYISPVLKSKIMIDSSLIYQEVNSYTYDSINHTVLRTGYEKVPAGVAVAKWTWALQYDNKANVVGINKENDVPQSFIWDYHNSYAIAKVVNATAHQIAYTSFEADGNGGWTGIDSANVTRDSSCLTGKKRYTFSGSTLTHPGLTAATRYTVSYWSRNGAYSVSGTQNGWPKTLQSITIHGQTWTNYLHEIANVTSVSVTGSGVIDELRLYPVHAQMTTYTYEPLIGMTSQCDVNNRIIYYEYDGVGRLKLIRDQDRNILKTFNYTYQEQQ